MQRRVLRAFRRRGLLDDDVADGMLTWRATGGFSVEASVRVEGDDRAGVERLVRYCARPPFALERLHALGGPSALASESARLLYRLPEPHRHGRTALVLSPLDLLERLSRLIPPPRLHRHRYHGVLAPHARVRASVVAIGRGAPEAAPDPPDTSPPASATGQPREGSPEPRRSSRIPWAQLPWPASTSCCRSCALPVEVR